MFLNCTYFFLLLSPNCYSKPIDLHKGSLQLSKTTFCCSALSINWTVLTSNSPGDWDSVIEIKILQAKKKKKVAGALEELLDLPRAYLEWSPKTKPVAGLRIFEYVLYNGAREPVHARGQWWKSNTSLAEEGSGVVLETVAVEIMTVFGNKIIAGVWCQPTFGLLCSCFPPKQGLIRKRLFLLNEESDASSLVTECGSHQSHLCASGRLQGPENGILLFIFQHILYKMN